MEPSPTPKYMEDDKVSDSGPFLPGTRFLPVNHCHWLRSYYQWVNSLKAGCWYPDDLGSHFIPHSGFSWVLWPVEICHTFFKGWMWPCCVREAILNWVSLSRPPTFSPNHQPRFWNFRSLTFESGQVTILACWIPGGSSFKILKCSALS